MRRWLIPGPIVTAGDSLSDLATLIPHLERYTAAEVIALERATLYGIVIYNNRRVNFGNVDAMAAREIFRSGFGRAKV